MTLTFREKKFTNNNWDGFRGKIFQYTFAVSNEKLVELQIQRLLEPFMTLVVIL